MNVPGGFGKRKNKKCLCCTNPWQNCDDDSVGIVCAPCLTDDKGFKSINPDNFDNSISPSDNFYLFSNGGWKKNNPIPGEYSSWNTFMLLMDQNQERLKLMLEELSNIPNHIDVNVKKLADFNNSFMDENTIEKLGIDPILELLNISKNSLSDPIAAIAEIHSKYSCKPLFSLHASPDKKDSEFSLCNLYQGGLGLPDRDYKEEKRSKYIEYITNIFNLLGENNFAPYNNGIEFNTNAARQVFEFEKNIASSHLTRTESRDPEVTYNKMSVDNLTKITLPDYTWGQYLTTGIPKVSFDWKRYFQLIGKPVEELGDINVAMIKSMKLISSIYDSKSLPHYLTFHSINSYAASLPIKFVVAKFNFFDKELQGTSEQRPRWKRSLSLLENALGEAIGQFYVAKYFDESAKARALSIVEKIRDALRERLGEVDWMTESTREQALLKMEGFKVKIGYPDEWIDYSSLNIINGSHMKNLFASHAFSFKRELKEMNAPTDKKKWHLTPQTINAYYHPSMNEIVFPAAILQAPFFDKDADDAVNFGSMGAVVGHEMTHGFDDQGRKYNYQGNMIDWWQESDAKEYEKRASVMVKQAETFEVHGIKLKGNLTQGENIADLGGLKLALRALKKHNSLLSTPPPLINGFTPIQRFFLAWSQSWRENVKEERAKLLITIDPHGPNELRCNGPLSNMVEFLEAFDVVPEDPMYKEESMRVDIW